MLQKFHNFSLALIIFFSAMNISYATPTEEEQLKEAKDLMNQLQNIQGTIDQGFGRETHQNNSELEDAYKEYKDVQVNVVQNEDKTYYYYILTFVGLNGGMNISVQNDSVKFSSKNKSINHNRKNHDGFDEDPAFYYAFQILHPNPDKKAEVIQNGNVVTIKVKKTNHHHNHHQSGNGRRGH